MQTRVGGGGDPPHQKLTLRPGFRGYISNATWYIPNAFSSTVEKRFTRIRWTPRGFHPRGFHPIEGTRQQESVPIVQAPRFLFLQSAQRRVGRRLTQPEVSTNPFSKSGSWFPSATKRAFASPLPPTIFYVRTHLDSTAPFEGASAFTGISTLNVRRFSNSRLLPSPQEPGRHDRVLPQATIPGRRTGYADQPPRLK